MIKSRLWFIPLIFALLFLIACGSPKKTDKPLTEYDFATALVEAKKQNKPIFVTLYADWCTHCKIMEKKIFPLEEVHNILENDFIYVRLNGDDPSLIPCGKGQMRATHCISQAWKLPVTYPLNFVLTPSQEVVHALQGRPTTGKEMVQFQKESLSVWKQFNHGAK